MPRAVETALTVQLLCFAQVKDLLGATELHVTLPAGATGRELQQQLAAHDQRLGALLHVSRLAVNCEYVPWDHELRDGDEVVIVPPVSGG